MQMADAACGGFPHLLSPSPSEQDLWPLLGSNISLNCTFRVLDTCHGVVSWLKDRSTVDAQYREQHSTWSGFNISERLFSSILEVNMTSPEDYGTFTCNLLNTTAAFTLHRTEKAGHVAAVLFALCVLTVLVVGSILYLKCRLNVRLWHRDNYGDPEISDGRLFDAYVSFCPSNVDTKFTNFILKPHLENKYGYKLHLDEMNLLPNTEPSAELLMNVSRCRRLVVVLSLGYLQQDWCQTNFREGLIRLLELAHRPIFIVFENQYKDLPAEVTQLLHSKRGSLKLLLWKAGSVSPSSDFWKELRLALPRKVPLPSGKGDPQTLFQEDKDPMLAESSETADPDPDGDLGVRRTLYKAPPPRMAPVTPTNERATTGDMDISDLGSRNYSARTDYYCLVTEPEL
ncbi:single Ig IL-1-related receptor [Pelobates cultripes]|uniref:Single Ig IL-1-related receptor n=1 Tax=Pelobates cultripes TaxID=61616 RepID=A0AAD1WSA3_PELCU|nr:single Ig IL-1-related receptor [Pelobates cultripes]